MSEKEVEEGRRRVECFELALALTPTSGANVCRHLSAVGCVYIIYKNVVLLIGWFVG